MNASVKIMYKNEKKRENMEIKDIFLHKYPSKRSFRLRIHSLLSIKLHLRDGRTDGQTPEIEFGASMTLVAIILMNFLIIDQISCIY